MKNILNFGDFLNESIITLSDDIISSLKKIYNLVDDESKNWVLTILRKSGTNIDLTPPNDFNYNIYNSLSDGYFNLEIDKGEKTIKQPFRIGKSLKLLVPDIPIHILSKISASLQSLQENKITLVEGDEISKYYRFDNIDNKGTLGSSCMQGKPKRYFELYEKNENVKLAILLNDEGILQGRALLWNTNKGWAMDRIYYTSDSYKYTFIDWAKSNNYITDISYNDEYIIDLEFIPEEFPYLDTFHFLCVNKKQLSNRDVFQSSDQVIYLDSTKGTFTVFRNYKLLFEEVYSITAIYKEIEYLTDLINLSIDFNKWYDEYIESEVIHYEDVDEFIDVYDSFIIENFNKLNLDNDITKDNIFDLLREYNESDKEKYNSIIKSTLRNRYSEEHGYSSWKDIMSEIYGDVKYNYHSQEWLKTLIKAYCSEDILNKNLKKLYDEDYYSYERITYDWNIY
jgi:hypothetical protein